MITDSGKYFLYRHIRLDKNIPFYIGIGTKKKYNTFKSIYARAFEKKGSRNKHWKNVINKTEYTVEILIESDNYDFIKQKEIEFIGFYSYLVNKTLGGEGFSSRHTEKSKNKIKTSKKIIKDNKKENIKENVINTYLKGETIIKIAKQNNVCKNLVRDILKEAKIIKNSSAYKKRKFYIFNTLNKSINEIMANYNEIVELTKITEPVIRKMMYTNKRIRKNNFYIVPKSMDLNEIENEYNNRLIKKHDKN